MINDALQALRSYYGELYAQSRQHVLTPHITRSDVLGLESACHTLDSINEGAMTPAEAGEYINDRSFDDMPGIKWARKAVSRSIRLTSTPIKDNAPHVK